MAALMAYLYAGLGIAMLVGIVSIFEMATSFDQAQLQWSALDSAKPSAFSGSDRVAYDAATATAMNLLKGEDCVTLFSMLKLPADYKSEAQLRPPFRCAFQKAEVVSSRVWIHRILIDIKGSYWSCAYDQSKASKCPFE